MKIKNIKLPPAPAKYPPESRLNFLIKDKDPFDEEQAARTCTRCGACLQKCPSFRSLKSELYSPRGRAQLLRFFFEKKLNPKQDKKDMLNSVRSCFMCGACTAFCPAKTPVADLMLSFSNALGGPAKTKGSNLLRFFYLAAAELKIKRHLKKQKEGEKIIFAPSFYASSQIKNILRILNASGFKAEADFSVINLELFYFSANIKKIKKALSALLKNVQTAQDGSIVTDGLETYAILKKASLFGQNFAPLEKRVKFLTEYIRSANKLKEDIPFKKIILCRNDIGANAELFTEQIRKLLICPKKHFLIECIQSKDLPPAAAAHWVKIKGEDAVKKQSAQNLCDIGADCIIVCSHTDKKLFEALVKRQSPRPAVLYIAQIPEVFYAED
ncbi:MAG: 4Fe-4S dicluster domain-containing protein [Elusimicrobiaceae bacterium]